MARRLPPGRRGTPGGPWPRSSGRPDAVGCEPASSVRSSSTDCTTGPGATANGTLRCATLCTMGALVEDLRHMTAAWDAIARSVVAGALVRAPPLPPDRRGHHLPDRGVVLGPRAEAAGPVAAGLQHPVGRNGDPPGGPARSRLRHHPHRRHRRRPPGRGRREPRRLPGGHPRPHRDRGRAAPASATTCASAPGPRCSGRSPSATAHGSAPTRSYWPTSRPAPWPPASGGADRHGARPGGRSPPGRGPEDRGLTRRTSRYRSSVKARAPIGPLLGRDPGGRHDGHGAVAPRQVEAHDHGGRRPRWIDDGRGHEPGRALGTVGRQRAGPRHRRPRGPRPAGCRPPRRCSRRRPGRARGTARR